MERDALAATTKKSSIFLLKEYITHINHNVTPEAYDSITEQGLLMHLINQLGSGQYVQVSKCP